MKSSSFDGDLISLCEKCLFFNGISECYKEKAQFMKVEKAEDCEDYQEDEDCGFSEEDLGIGQDDPDF